MRLPSLLFLVACVAARAATAEPPATAATPAPGATPPPTITKIVSRHSAPDIAPDSFAAKPKTLYLSGTTYLRIEEEPDPAERIHGLVICAEPDIWMINRFGRPSGQHMVDPGPTFETHANIIGKDAPGDLSILEFGRELDFLRRYHGTRLEPQVLDGQSCKATEYTAENRRVVIYLRADTGKPHRGDCFKDGKPEFSVHYLSYETDLPFDAALFRPPAGVPLEDVKSTAPSR